MKNENKTNGTTPNKVVETPNYTPKGFSYRHPQKELKPAFRCDLQKTKGGGLTYPMYFKDYSEFAQFNCSLVQNVQIMTELLTKIDNDEDTKITAFEIGYSLKAVTELLGVFSFVNSDILGYVDKLEKGSYRMDYRRTTKRQ